MYLEQEPVSYGMGRSFASIVFAGRRFVCPYHRHPEIELVAIDAGSGRLVAGDYTGTFQAGDLFLLGENLPHIFQNRELEKNAVRRACSHVIQFRRDFAGDRLFAIPEFRPVQQLLQVAGRGLKLSGQCKARVRNKMRSLHEADSARRVPLLLELLCDLAVSRSRKPLASAAYDKSAIPADGRMPAVMAYIQENFTEPLPVPQVARKAGLTPNAFCRYFKQNTHRTFTDVVNETRIKEACLLLCESHLPVTEIAYASGFRNLAHFHVEFLKRMRATPLQFRKQNKA
jgi:AraC-like DNA-binding protein